MRQQINLYQPIEGEDRRPLESRTLGFVAGGVVACLLVIWGFGMYQVAGLERAVQSLHAQQSAQEQAMSEMGAQRPANLNPAQLQNQVKALDAEVTARNQALAILRVGGAGQKGGFAERLEALARRHTDGLWIDRVVLSGTTGAMSVGGATVNPDLVPTYLRALAGESALHGARFDQLTIERHSSSSEPADGETDRNGIRFRADSNALRVAADPEKAS